MKLIVSRHSLIVKTAAAFLRSFCPFKIPLLSLYFFDRGVLIFCCQCTSIHTVVEICLQWLLNKQYIHEGTLNGDFSPQSGNTLLTIYYVLFDLQAEATLSHELGWKYYILRVPRVHILDSSSGFRQGFATGVPPKSLSQKLSPDFIPRIRRVCPQN